MTQSHLEQRLKDLQGNLELMEALYLNQETPHELSHLLYAKIVTRIEQIQEVRKEIDKAKLELLNKYFSS